MAALQEVTAFVPSKPEVCWRAFTDASTLVMWVPGLRRARVIAADAAGLPLEIVFEFGSSRMYSLVYTYDVAKLEVTWQPRAGKRDAVAGYARFADAPGGTLISYGLKQGDARSPAEKAQGDLASLVSGFAHWMADVV